MVRAFVVIGFFVTTPVLLLGCILFLILLKSQTDNSFTHQSHQSVKFAALPSNEVNPFANEIIQDDIRIGRLKRFFSEYKSPLFNYAEDIVKTSDTYALDYRLVPAIAMQESTLCEKAPKETNNCWGYGIYGKHKMSFKDYGEGVQTVAKTLGITYKMNGLETPQEIMKKYTPSNDGTWAYNVNSFMNEIGPAIFTP